MTTPIHEDFLDMVEIERALRTDIIEYEYHDLSPADFGVRVLKHLKDLKPTGPLKMRKLNSVPLTRIVILKLRLWI